MKEDNNIINKISEDIDNYLIEVDKSIIKWSLANIIASVILIVLSIITTNIIFLVIGLLFGIYSTKILLKYT